jgi:ubiquitin C-terminal hydrolase
MRASPSASPTEDPLRPTGTRKSRRSVDRNIDNEEELKFCALCSLEHHLEQVHDSSQPPDKPVAPEAFVRGFVNHVAPWMRIGIQEDSHEFLRLLIDAMQKSCLKARSDKENTKVAATTNGAASTTEDEEYSFSLFRGLVESNVTCEYCKASSSTVDPIEDIGLEVTSSTPALADVQSAFTRFAGAEPLDSNYKCEKCGKVGKATKQSRLKSIPPILTLHLKRFRYGDSRVGADAMPRRSGRSEVKSGSAKIEGHVKFEVLFDLKPFLTKEMQEASKSVLCRLFAVVVHAGKNSNSGH